MTITILPEKAVELLEEANRRLAGTPLSAQDTTLIEATIWRVIRDHVSGDLLKLWEECRQRGLMK